MLSVVFFRVGLWEALWPRCANDYEIVGKCIECNKPYDTICGSRVCTVCHDLVLICNKCQANPSFREYHCKKHQPWKHCYYTFLEIYTIEQLQQQNKQLDIIYNTQLLPPKQHKNTRRTIKKQIEKVRNHVKLLETGQAQVMDPVTTPRKCRTCYEPLNIICDGKCWGFWKTSQRKNYNQQTSTLVDPILPISIGDIVMPGPNWNILKLGNQSDVNIGTVVEIKSWGSGSGSGNAELDCVAVLWDSSTASTRRNQAGKIPQPQIYRWGVIALNGTRMYDVQHYQEQHTGTTSGLVVVVEDDDKDEKKER